MTNSINNSYKKIKTDSESIIGDTVESNAGVDSEALTFEQVRRYLLDIRDVPVSHPAVQAALNGLEKAWKQHVRDAKLREKFAVKKQDELGQNIETISTFQNSHNTMVSNNDATIEKAASRIGSNTKSHGAGDLSLADSDWQDVAAPSPREAEVITVDDDDNEDSAVTDAENGSSSFASIGTQLASEAIAMMARHNPNDTRVSSPLAAIAVALHAALRSDTLGFQCTGIPDKDNSSSKGFAAPVRELPPAQFLPKEWNEIQRKDSIALRYRKQGVGSFVLLVVGTQDDQQQNSLDLLTKVSLFPANSSQEPIAGSPLCFFLSEHINLESFSRALKEQTSIPPALHYKSLSKLLTRFAATFDLGHINENSSAEAASNVNKDSGIFDSVNYIDVTSQSLPTAQQRIITSFTPHDSNVRSSSTNWPHPSQFPYNTDREIFTDTNLYEGTEFGLQSPHQPQRSHGGDFHDDLYPGGFSGPPNLGPLPSDAGMGSGNLVGPNHPLFGGVGHTPGSSGGYLRPRFDPIGPPGGPTEPPQFENPFGQRPYPPGGTGVPNDTSLRMPGINNAPPRLNNSRNNMFL